MSSVTRLSVVRTDGVGRFKKAETEDSCAENNESFRIEPSICAVSQIAEPFLQAMSINLPSIIQKYIDASNAHDVKAIVVCFTDNAIVRDENATMRGKIEIERWITTTIEKYKFQFKPLASQERDNETVVSVEVSGTFPGSPISLDYHFAIANEKIASLTIDS
jgi:SnoaL-like domain